MTAATLNCSSCFFDTRRYRPGAKPFQLLTDVDLEDGSHMFVRLGLLDNYSALLSGPSNAGLMEPGQAKTENRVIPLIDGLLAATAMQHNLTLVTRDRKDVVLTGVPVFNPWES